jgi:hypothetical protein
LCDELINLEAVFNKVKGSEAALDLGPFVAHVDREAMGILCELLVQGKNEVDLCCATTAAKLGKALDEEKILRTRCSLLGFEDLPEFVVDNQKAFVSLFLQLVCNSAEALEHDGDAIATRQCLGSRIIALLTIHPLPYLTMLIVRECFL